jgi:hypothetical protein
VKTYVRFAAFLNQKPPFRHDVFRDLEDTAVKHGTHLVRRRLLQFRAPIDFANKLNSEANLGNGYNFDAKVFQSANRSKIQRPSYRALAVVIPAEHLYRAATPSERNITHRAYGRVLIPGQLPCRARLRSRHALPQWSALTAAKGYGSGVI